MLPAFTGKLCLQKEKKGGGGEGGGGSRMAKSFQWLIDLIWTSLAATII